MTAWDVWQEYKDDDTVFGIAFFRGDKRVHAIDWQDVREEDPWMQMTGTGNNMMGFVHFWMDVERQS